MFQAPTRYLVINRRHKLPTLYFGPFVSVSKANDFVNTQFDLEQSAAAEIKPILGRTTTA